MEFQTKTALGTMFRYAAWDADGRCFLYKSQPRFNPNPLNGVKFGWLTSNGEKAGSVIRSFRFDNLVSEEFARENFIDYEREEDRKLIRALLEL